MQHAMLRKQWTFAHHAATAAIRGSASNHLQLERARVLVGTHATCNVEKTMDFAHHAATAAVRGSARSHLQLERAREPHDVLVEMHGPALGLYSSRGPASLACKDF
jgi:hypothetical protein